MKMLTEQLLKDLPPLYANEGRGLEAKAIVKFFTPWTSWTWYGSEYDPKTGLFFGLVSGLDVELGYFSLPELESIQGPWGLRVERDLHFTPQTLGSLKDMHTKEMYG